MNSQTMNSQTTIKTQANITDHSVGLDSDNDLLQKIQKIDHAHRSGDWREGFPVVDVPVPNSVVIDCPLVRPAKIMARECCHCEHFLGVVQTSWSDDQLIPWDAKYGIRCGKPLERKCSSIVSIVR